MQTDIGHEPAARELARKRIALAAYRKLELWAKQWPGTNWGVATGAASGVIVLDVDPRHQGDETLYEMCRQHGQLPPTPQCVTGGGGRHLYFKHPGNGHLIKNSVGGLGPGLDIRGDSGFVVLAGSAHASGQPYRWDEQHHPDSVPLAPAPEWLVYESKRETERQREQSNRVWTCPRSVGARTKLFQAAASNDSGLT